MELNAFQRDILDKCIGKIAYAEEGQPKITGWEPHKNPLATGGAWLILENEERIWLNVRPFPKVKKRQRRGKLVKPNIPAAQLIPSSDPVPVEVSQPVMIGDPLLQEPKKDIHGRHRRRALSDKEMQDRIDKFEPGVAESMPELEAFKFGEQMVHLPKPVEGYEYALVKRDK